MSEDFALSDGIGGDRQSPAGLRPVAIPLDTVARVAVFETIGRIAPRTPAWFQAAMTRMLISDRPMPSDAFLITADALDEASLAAATFGEMELAAQLHQLADLPRKIAAARAKRGD